MSSRIWRRITGPTLTSVDPTIRSTLIDVGRCACTTPNWSRAISVSQPRRVVVHGTTTTAACRTSSTSFEVTTIAGRMKPGSPRAGVPKSMRTTSPARIGNIRSGSIQNEELIGLKGRRAELLADDPSPLFADQRVDLGVEGAPFSVGQLAQRVTSPNCHLDGSCIGHTQKYTESSTAVSGYFLARNLAVANTSRSRASKCSSGSVSYSGSKAF